MNLKDVYRSTPEQLADDLAAYERDKQWADEGLRSGLLREMPMSEMGKRLKAPLVIPVRRKPAVP